MTVLNSYAPALNAALIIQNMRATCEHKFAKRGGEVKFIHKNQCVKCGIKRNELEQK